MLSTINTISNVFLKNSIKHWKMDWESSQNQSATTCWKFALQFPWLEYKQRWLFCCFPPPLHSKLRDELKKNEQLATNEKVLYVQRLVRDVFLFPLWQFNHHRWNFHLNKIWIKWEGVGVKHVKSLVSFVGGSMNKKFI